MLFPARRPSYVLGIDSCFLWVWCHSAWTFKETDLTSNPDQVVVVVLVVFHAQKSCYILVALYLDCNFLDTIFLLGAYTFVSLFPTCIYTFHLRQPTIFLPQLDWLVFKPRFPFTPLSFLPFILEYSPPSKFLRECWNSCISENVPFCLHLYAKFD